MSSRVFAVPLAVVAMALPAVASAQQTRPVTGTVTATGTNQPLPDITISVAGTTTVTRTNERGEFRVVVPASGDATVIARGIGWKRTPVRVAAGQSTVTIALEKDVLQLEQMVVTGAATSISRRNAANDVAQVSAEQLTRVATPTVENALQGKIAGANIVTNSGAPGGGAQFRIRGASSILGSTDPLIIVDGVAISNDAIQPGTNAVLGASGGSNASTQDNGVNRIADLNPNDIENIEVLKGASAAQIYGSRAGNGVVIITTKKGTSGAPKFNLTQRFGTYSLMTKVDAKHYTLDEAIARGDDAGMTEQEVRDSYASCGGFCDHQQQLFGNTDPSYETNLSVRGGGNVAQYFVSGLVKRDAGIAANTGYNKQSLRANLNTTISPKLTAQVNTQLTHALTQRGFSNNDNVNVTPYFVFAATPSFFDLRPVNGVYPANPFSSSNPLETYDRSKTPEEVWRLIGSANLDYSVLNTDRQMLTVRLNGGVDQFNQQNQVITPRDLQFECSDGLCGTATYQAGNNVYGNGGLSLTHTFKPTPAYTFTTSGGAQHEYRSQRVSNIVSRDVLAGQENIQRGSSSEVFDFRLRQVDQAFYIQEEFLGFDERLALTAAVRGQRSSVNGDAEKFYTFPKFSASYQLPRFFSALNDFKVRAAYGQAGNPPLTTAQFTPVVGVVYNGNNGVQLSSRQGDPNIKPERQAEFEGGVDIAAFNSRASLSITGYRRNLTDLLIRPALAPSTGFTSKDINAGEMQNTGLEIAAAVTPVQTARTSWISRVTFARNKGKVISLPEDVGHIQCLNEAGTGRETNPLKCPRGFTNGAFGFFYGQGRIEEGASPTQIVGQDTIPGGGGVTYQVKMGDTEPSFSLGWANDVTFGPFRLYGLIDTRQGFEVVNLTQSTYDDLQNYGDQAGTDRRHELGDAGISPYIQDGSFVKLREVTFSYQMPQTLVNRFLGNRASSLSLELSGRNLATWTKYEGVDPEVSNFGNTNIVRNQDLAPFPPSRSFFFSVNVGF